MLIIFLVVGVALIIIGVSKSKQCKYYEPFGWYFGGAWVIGLTIVAMIVLVALLSCCSLCDAKIAAREEHNAKIEEQIQTTIQYYIDYEKEIYGNIKLEDLQGEKLIMITSIYPELKANTLIQDQIALYKENNASILELRNQKINASAYKFWLYFGG